MRSAATSSAARMTMPISSFRMAVPHYPPVAAARRVRRDTPPSHGGATQRCPPVAAARRVRRDTPPSHGGATQRCPPVAAARRVRRDTPPSHGGATQRCPPVAAARRVRRDMPRAGSATRERREHLDDRPLGQRHGLRRAGGRLFPVHQERGPGQHPAKLRGGRPPRHRRGQRLGQGGSIDRLLGYPGGMLRRCPVAHSYHWHVGYPRSHRLRAMLPRALRQIHGEGGPSHTVRRGGGSGMSELYLLTNATEAPSEIMPALGLLLHTVRTGAADMIVFEDAAASDAILVDARHDLMSARQLCQLLRRAAPQAPVLALMTEGGLAAVTAEWGADDVVLCSAGPAEFEARLRLALGRQASALPAAPDEIRSGELSIDEATYTARLRARVLDLTFKEFELLKFLAQHPGRVFTRE